MDFRGQGRGCRQGRQQMLIHGFYASWRPAGRFGPVSNSLSTLDSAQHKQLIALCTKNATVNWPVDIFSIVMEAAAMYTDIVVIFDQYRLPIVTYDDLQQIRYTLPKSLNPENDNVKTSSFNLFGFLSFNTQSNQYIKAILSP